MRTPIPKRLRVCRRAEQGGQSGFAGSDRDLPFQSPCGPGGMLDDGFPTLCSPACLLAESRAGSLHMQQVFAGARSSTARWAGSSKIQVQESQGEAEKIVSAGQVQGGSMKERSGTVVCVHWRGPAGGTLSAPPSSLRAAFTAHQARSRHSRLRSAFTPPWSRPAPRCGRRAAAAGGASGGEGSGR